ncbi:MAG: 2-succinyl-5-enolpyruvyl-6-hydroxy-3-cyclohexene-1-carboxylic-acid synthase [Pseudonocardiales bacterium]|nr:2-succinyl-5-enolpyruvyl-6-hydroxy-3-cyclohexene-1-carboxylic-acid synthase [Pseudonocardiales bacterium]MBV9031607.1 2-succinyl-5-enolpyruvyl-6-hydroxy-3-cyclohexene-1-carboxylic-acid synthase [Pseudonocardiales bacterium]MBW0009159.1 2-succinyl-5-enolpyruvyl-6-hydroxy-3-cyclohexene-1-carboxylic-acid synthase [Pseudonocardiales bacterium]
MNPSTALATVLVDELVRCGVRHAVLCPGSRNAPLSFALHAAEQTGRLTLHVRIDERSAAFLALGLALRSGLPVPVVCTSGTAAANLHPAVLEAHHAGIPLLAVTADRPLELVGTGANQTVAQTGLFGAAVRATPSLATPLHEPWDCGWLAHWRSTVDRAVAAARGALGGGPGPVHLNVPLREPLVPRSDEPLVPRSDPADPALPDRSAALRGRPGGVAWTAVPSASPVRVEVELDLGRPTLVVAGHGAPPAPPGLPLVAEPTAADWSGALAAGPWLLGSPALERLRPEQVLVLGRPTLHRSVQRLLADPAVAVTVRTDRPEWTDVAGTAVAVGTALRCVGSPDPEWLRQWWQADERAAAAVSATVRDHPFGTGLVVARRLVAALPAGALLLVGSSNPIRDVSLAARPRRGLTVLANRGVAGIDGTIATATGAALAHSGPGYALVGDLTFLHDANGLLAGPDEARPDLTVVVANDDGGGIFGLLEQGAPAYADAFERVFGTPHGTDLAALCAAHHVPHVRVPVQELAEVLVPARGLRVVEVRTERTGLRALHHRIRTAVAMAVAPVDR